MIQKHSFHIYKNKIEKNIEQWRYKYAKNILISYLKSFIKIGKSLSINQIEQDSANDNIVASNKKLCSFVINILGKTQLSY